MATNSMSYEETCSVQKKLEISPSANAASSPVYGGGKMKTGKKKK